MHIELTDDNKSKYLKASGALELSVGELCNRILASVSVADLKMLITFAPQQNSEAREQKKKNIVRRESNWKINPPDW